jgi:hypothetical protein
MSEQKSLEDRKVDVFIDEMHKKVSNEIKQRNKEKKFLCELADQDVTSGLSCDTKTITYGSTEKNIPNTSPENSDHKNSADNSGNTELTKVTRKVFKP